MLNPETDEVDAFRTTKNLLMGDSMKVEDVSLYIFRDAKSDRRGEEKYHILFFNSPEGQKSLVKVITDLLESRELEMPKALRIVLRGYDMPGADYPVYSLTDHFFAMSDGSDGNTSLFDGFYNTTFDGDTFESEYTRIEGIKDGNLNVTVKQEQNVWPEWTGDSSAKDIQDDTFTLKDDTWYDKDDNPVEIPESNKTVDPDARKASAIDGREAA